jgi:Flp pilus assembly pilin Flp
MIRKLHAFLKDETAFTAIEYGLTAAGIISISVVATVFGLGSDRNDTYAFLPLSNKSGK